MFNSDQTQTRGTNMHLSSRKRRFCSYALGITVSGLVSGSGSATVCMYASDATTLPLLYDHHRRVCTLPCVSALESVHLGLLQLPLKSVLLALKQCHNWLAKTSLVQKKTSEETFQVCRSQVLSLPILKFDIQNISYHSLRIRSSIHGSMAATLRLHPE